MLDELTRHLDEQLADLAPLEQSVVTDEERSVISRNVARVERAGEERVSEVIRNGEYPKFLGYEGLEGLVRAYPKLAF